MRVIGIDPGYDRLGIAVLEGTTGAERFIFSTCIETARGDSLPDRIAVAADGFMQVLHEYKPDMVALETLFFNQNRNTAMGVAQLRGAVIYIAKKHGCTITEYGPQEVKVATTGYGKSDKGAVITMVKQLISGVPAVGHDDEYDAIAVALTALAHFRSNTSPTL